MFRKFSLVLAVLLLATPAFAATLPPMSAGAYWNFKDGAINHMETLEVARFFNTIAIEGGYGGDNSQTDHSIVLALTVDIKQLHLGNYVKLPILDLIEFRPALVGYFGHINGQDLSGGKAGIGLGASFISTKW